MKIWLGEFHRRTVTFSRLGSWGQFGNQLFQIAAVLAYARKFGNVPRFPPWICALSGVRYDAYFPWIKAFYGSVQGAAYMEPNFQYSELPARRRIDLHGHFQSERYFSAVRDDIRELYSEPPCIAQSLDKFCAQNGLGVFDAMHVRFYSHPSRDTGQGPLVALPEIYFQRAEALMGDDVPLVVATDDKSRLGDMLKSICIRRPVRVLNFDNHLLDFYMLSRARKIAISNSTFSWWGAYLGNRKTQIIAPQRFFWFNETERRNPFWNTADLYPAEFEELIF